MPQDPRKAKIMYRSSRPQRPCQFFFVVTGVPSRPGANIFSVSREKHFHVRDSNHRGDGVKGTWGPALAFLSRFSKELRYPSIPRWYLNTTPKENWKRKIRRVSKGKMRERGGLGSDLNAMLCSCFVEIVVRCPFTLHQLYISHCKL